MVMDDSVLFCTTASIGGSGGCFLAAGEKESIGAAYLNYSKWDLIQLPIFILTEG